MGSDEDASGITREEMAAREEANLRLPGSRLVHEEGSDEGEGWGFDHVLKSAMLQRTWSVDALADEILSWYRGQLTSRGWTLTNSHAQTPDHPIGSDFYDRGSEELIVRVFDRARDRPGKMYRERDDTGVHYDITYSDRSSNASDG